MKLNLKDAKIEIRTQLENIEIWAWNNPPQTQDDKLKKAVAEARNIFARLIAHRVEAAYRNGDLLDPTLIEGWIHSLQFCTRMHDWLWGLRPVTYS